MRTFTFVNFVIRELTTYERNHLLLDGERERHARCATDFRCVVKFERCSGFAQSRPYSQMTLRFHRLTTLVTEDSRTSNTDAAISSDTVGGYTNYESIDHQSNKKVNLH